MRFVALGFVAAAVAGCAEAPPATITCTGAANAAVAIVLMDARTLALSPFSDVRATAQSGANQDSTHVTAITEDDVRAGKNAIGFGLGRPGAFHLTVSARGFKPWARNNFITTNNLKCQYHSDTIVVRLQRL